MKKGKPCYAQQNWTTNNFPVIRPPEKIYSAENKSITSFPKLSTPPIQNDTISQYLIKSPAPKIEYKLIQLEQFIPKEYSQEISMPDHPHYINLY